MAFQPLRFHEFKTGDWCAGKGKGARWTRSNRAISPAGKGWPAQARNCRYHQSKTGGYRPMQLKNRSIGVTGVSPVAKSDEWKMEVIYGSTNQ